MVQLCALTLAQPNQHTHPFARQITLSVFQDAMVMGLSFLPVARDLSVTNPGSTFHLSFAGHFQSCHACCKISTGFCHAYAWRGMEPVARLALGNLPVRVRPSPASRQSALPTHIRSRFVAGGANRPHRGCGCSSFGGTRTAAASPRWQHSGGEAPRHVKCESQGSGVRE